MSKSSNDKINEIEKIIIEEVKSQILERLYGSGEKIHLSKTEKEKIHSKFYNEISSIIKRENKNLEIKQKEIGLDLKDIGEKIKTNAKKATIGYIIFVIFALTLGGILSFQEFKNLATQKAANLIVEKSNLKNDIIKAVTDSLSRSNNEIIESIKIQQQQYVKQLYTNAQKSDSLIIDIDKHYKYLVEESTLKFRDVINVLEKVEHNYSIK